MMRKNQENERNIAKENREMREKVLGQYGASAGKRKARN
jgi:hypothetical protein